MLENTENTEEIESTGDAQAETTAGQSGAEGQQDSTVADKFGGNYDKAVEAHAQLEKKLGGRVDLDKYIEKDENKKSLLSKLGVEGVPEKFEDYGKGTFGEGDNADENRGVLLKTFYDSGIPESKLKTLEEGLNTLNSSVEAAKQVEFDGLQETVQTSLEAEWGEKFEENNAHVNKALPMVGLDDSEAYNAFLFNLNETGRVKAANVLKELGARMGENAVGQTNTTEDSLNGVSYQEMESKMQQATQRYLAFNEDPTKQAEAEAAKAEADRYGLELTKRDMEGI